MLDNLDPLRHIEGFPIGKDEELHALSNPPYYTAYPNPHIADFIKQYGKPYDEATDDYHREPYVENEKFGRTDTVYNSHSYHTKVPPQAIKKYIEHYTQPGDIVVDFFSGTGMMGVAAQRCQRKAILFDLSPAATFIGANNVVAISKEVFLQKGLEILREVQLEFGYLYETEYGTDQKGNIIYTIWTDIVKCPYCQKESKYWDLFHNTPKEILTQKKNQTYIKCFCNAIIESGDFLYVLDSYGKRTQVPVMVSCVVGKKRYLKQASIADIQLAKKIESIKIPYWFPTDKFMHRDGKWGDLWRGYHIGLDAANDFYMTRNLMVLSAIYDKICKITDKLLRNKLLFTFTAVLPRVNKLNRYMPEHERHVGPLSGTLYVSKLPVEINVLENFSDKLIEIANAGNISDNSVFVSTQSSTNLSQITDATVDYVFVDPPFGDNLPYAELNFLSESWLKIFTNTGPEAIVSEIQGKKLDTYRNMMYEAFCEGYRILKPKRWITVEFHNSKASVWNAIQDALSRAGFIVAQVLILDKKKGTTKQLSYAGAVSNDLIINAYKPHAGFTQRLISQAGRGLEADFVREHLRQLPIAINVERSKEMLYSKYLAYYVQHGYQVAYNGEQFYRALAQWGLEERDGYWFADEAQAQEYEQRKLKTFGKKGIAPQAVLFISDERSARQWLWNFLDEPKTYDEIYTKFMPASQTAEDKIPEPKQLLEESFVMIGNLWKRPDQLTQAELEQKRLERLLRQFNEYLQAAQSGQKLKEVRREAVMAGFTECYRAGKFQDIVTLGRKLDKRLLEESPELFDFVDIAETKVEG